MIPRLRCIARLAGFWRNRAGTTVIETAIVAPVLVILALGTFDISRMIARQHELQNSATDVEGIVLAVASSATGTNASTIKTVLVNSLQVPSDKVTVDMAYRCGTTNTLIADKSTCASSEVLATYVKVTITDTVTPMWTNFGVGGPLNYNVVRTVQVS